MNSSLALTKAMKPALFLVPVACCAALLALTARAETHINVDLGLRLGPPPPIVVREAPPRPIVVEEHRYESPGPDYVWVSGHHTWRDGRWVWVSGTWARPPQPGAIYVEGRWDERPRNWTESHWEVVARSDDRDRWDRRGPSGVELVVEAPPPPRHEHRDHRPGPDYLWIDGYWAWHGRHHEWVAGRWERPPQGRREWVAPRWEHRENGYVFIEGSWH